MNNGVFMKNSSKYQLFGAKIVKRPKKLRFLIKDFLVKFYDFQQEDSIKDWLTETFKDLITKVIDIIITGILVYIALIPFGSVLKYFTGYHILQSQIPTMIISYGFIWAAGEKIHTIFVNGRMKANAALPRTR